MKTSQGSLTNDISPVSHNKVRFQAVNEGTSCVATAIHGITDERTLSNTDHPDIEGDTRVSLKATVRSEPQVENLLGSFRNPYKAENISKKGELSRNCFYPAERGVMCDNTNKMQNNSGYQRESFKGIPPAEPFKSIPPAFFSLEEGRVTPTDKGRAEGPPLIIQRGYQYGKRTRR